MLISFVLRLRPDGLAAGEIVGEVEDIESGARHAVRETADLVAFCRRMTATSRSE
ncbi:MAG TPA: hypothetical protein VFW24_07605 [Acidimicrobiales bacterium]|nr:hypothetical protein [Acidimicrobiales bacterium]